METLKYNSKEEIMALPFYQRKRYLKKLKNYKKTIRKKQRKAEIKIENEKRW